jgi:DNA-binding NarL/FixJ family response regulator
MRDSLSARILLAVDSSGLLRVLEHLLHDLPRIEIHRSTNIARDAVRLTPDVIVTTTRMMGRDGSPSAAELRRLAPGSKLILITADREWWQQTEMPGVADASFDEEDVVRCLPPIVHILATGSETVAVD